MLPPHAAEFWLGWIQWVGAVAAGQAAACSNKKRSPLCLQGFQLIPADFALSNILREVTFKLQRQGRGPRVLQRPRRAPSLRFFAAFGLVALQTVLLSTGPYAG